MRNPNASYTLRIFNGGKNNQFARSSSAVVTVNGVEVAGTSAFNQSAALIERSVTLALQNTLVVEVRSAPGSGITIEIVGVDLDAPTVQITAPANGATLNTIQVTVTGAVSDATSEVAGVTCNQVAANLSGANLSCDLQLTEGANTIVVRATDLAGNVATASVNVTVSTSSVQTVVPRLADLSRRFAESAIAAARLAVGSVTTGSDNRLPAGYVLSQSPAYGTVISAGSPVNLVVSSGPTSATPPISFVVDTNITPPLSALPGFADGVARPLASIVDSHGKQANFIENELLVMTNDTNALNAFIARWQGTRLLTIDPANFGMDGLSRMHLVRINTGLADASTLVNHLRAITPYGQGVHRLSSQSGLQLLAAAAQEAAGGLMVVVNWVGSGDDFRNRTTTEAQTCSGCTVTPDPNADRPKGYVNAYNAVLEGFGGNEPPTISILAPANGASLSHGSPLVFRASVSDREGLTRSIVWTSDVDGEIGTGTTFERPDLKYGTHTITAKVTDMGGLVDMESITVTIVNDRPPTVAITSPADRLVFQNNQNISFSGTSSDPNKVIDNLHPDPRLPDADVAWHLDGSTPPFATGHMVNINTSIIGPGMHAVTFIGTDNEVPTTAINPPFTASDVISFTIEPSGPLPGQPPAVSTTRPANNAVFGTFPIDDTTFAVDVILEGAATDPEGGALPSGKLIWTTRSGSNPEETLGIGSRLTARLFRQGLAPRVEHFITLYATDNDGNTGIVATGDLNRDDHLDIVTSEPASNRVFVYLGDGSGGFSQAQDSPVPVSGQLIAMAIGDLTNDGNPDLASSTTENGVSYVDVLPGRGDGRFFAVIRVPVAGSPIFTGVPRDIAIGDLNGDGFADIASADSNSGSVMMNNQAGGFNTLPNLFIPGGASAVVIGDFNGDAILDLAFATTELHTIRLFAGTSGGGFAAPVSALVPTASPLTDMAGRDMTGDGRPDLVIAGGGVHVMISNGSGGFRPALRSPYSAVNGSTFVTVGDLNNDGLPDVVVSGQEITVLLNRR